MSPAYRYSPVVHIAIAGTTGVELDLVSATVDLGVTEKVPAIALTLNDADQKYSDLPLPWNGTISLLVDGSSRFVGRIDSLSPPEEKAQGRILTVKGRHTGSAALEDYVANLQVSGTPEDIVTAIIARYTSMRGTTYTADPPITIMTNAAPDDITMEFDWRRKSFWKMLYELQEALGAPVAEGGKDEFYDFFLDPGYTGNFYFVPMASLDSAVVVPENTELLKANRTIDGLPVKNEIYLWCNAGGGAVPYEMQEGWNNTQLVPIPWITDPWTEGNAADYSKDVGLGGSIDIEDHVYTPAEIAADDIGVGYQCIRIYGTTSPLNDWEKQYAYWSMKFGHFPPAAPEAFHLKLDGFTNQDPHDMLNLANETHMNESMGEVSAVSFLIKDCINPLLGAWQLSLECVDVDDNVVRSSSGTARATEWAGFWLTQKWLPAQINIGPTVANWTRKTGTSFDWTAVKELRFLVSGQRAAFDFYFDGFKFVKPLIAHARYVSGTAQEKTCRSIVIAKEKIANYQAALLTAQGLLETQKRPNVYWNFEDIGRTDIPSGYKFTLGSTELLMRDQKWSMTKEGGWLVTATALEKT
jgi:hypothetical protein